MSKESLDIIYILVVVWGILNIILFFKLWGMTNDVKDIKIAILQKNNTHHVDKFDVGSIVINTSTNEELRILGSYKDGSYFCCENVTNEPRGIIHESILKLK